MWASYGEGRRQEGGGYRGGEGKVWKGEREGQAGEDREVAHKCSSISTHITYMTETLMKTFNRIEEGRTTGHIQGVD